MRIRKAIITAAGYGSRMLPVSKVVQKELLPVLRRPIIDYIVEDCLKAGIDQFVVIVNEGVNQVSEYYSDNKLLNSYLRDRNKDTELQQLKKLSNLAHFEYIVQPPSAPYGTTTPLKLAMERVETEDAFLVFMGDDFVVNYDGTSEAKRMIDVFTKTDSIGLSTFIPVPKHEVSKYGVAKYRMVDNVKVLDSIVEKPSVETAPSNLINISKYIFTPKVFEIIEKQKIDPNLNELLITDTVSELTKSGNVLLYETKGEYFDCGNIASWLKTNIKLALNDPELRTVVKEAMMSDEND